MPAKEMPAKDTFGSIGGEGTYVSRLTRSFEDLLEDLEAGRSPDRVREAIRRHPVLVLGAAALLGFVLGSLKRR